MFYKLDENKNVIQSSLEEWSNMIEGKIPINYIHVGDDEINGFRISTVFIGLCHDFILKNNIPRVFETMIFHKDGHDIYMKRYSTWQEAEEGHKDAVEWVKNGCKDHE